LSLQGYGITLGAINGLNVLSSILQAIPNLQVQVLTLLTWMVSRFFMYSRCSSRALLPQLLNFLVQLSSVAAALRNVWCSSRRCCRTAQWLTWCNQIWHH
jgi:hypothetical protein